MSLTYTLRPKADRDVDDIADELAERANLDVGLRFLALVYETFALIGNQPAMGWHCRLQGSELEDVRVFRVRDPFSRYLIFYLPSHERIEVLRVLHGTQDLKTRLSVEGLF